MWAVGWKHHGLTQLTRCGNVIETLGAQSQLQKWSLLLDHLFDLRVLVWARDLRVEITKDVQENLVGEDFEGRELCCRGRHLTGLKMRLEQV